MLISVKNRFIFVANFESGSQAVEDALLSAAEIHRRGAKRGTHLFMRQAIPEYDFLFSQPETGLQTFFKFGVMRDPANWIYALYRHKAGLKANRVAFRSKSFADFWQETRDSGEAASNKRQQKDFFTRMKGGVLVDYLIPYENLVDEFAFICGHLGIAATLKLPVESPVDALSEPLTAEIRQEIRDFYAQDYALLDTLAEINARGMERLVTTRPATA